VEDLEAQIINPYQPVLNGELEPKLEPTPPARITHKVALEELETLTYISCKLEPWIQCNSSHSIENNAEFRVRKEQEEANKGKGHWRSA